MINNITNKIKNKINEQLINEPYKIEIINHTDVTKQKPYTIKVNFLYKDKLFEKRINNLLKDNKYVLNYQFYDNNVGTFFKPSYEKNINLSFNIDTSIEYTIIDKLIIETISYGFIEINLKDKILLKKLDNYIFSFKDKNSQLLFSKKIEKELDLFFKKEYEIYTKIKE